MLSLCRTRESPFVLTFSRRSTISRALSRTVPLNLRHLEAEVPQTPMYPLSCLAFRSLGATTDAGCTSDHMWRDIANVIIVITLLAVSSPSRWTTTRTSPSSRVLLAVPLRITALLALSSLVRSRSRAAPFSWSDKCLPGSSSMLLQRCPRRRWCQGHKRCGLQHGMRRQFDVRFSHDVRYFRP